MLFDAGCCGCPDCGKLFGGGKKQNGPVYLNISPLGLITLSPLMVRNELYNRCTYVGIQKFQLPPSPESDGGIMYLRASILSQHTSAWGEKATLYVDVAGVSRRTQGGTPCGAWYQSYDATTRDGWFFEANALWGGKRGDDGDWGAVLQMGYWFIIDDPNNVDTGDEAMWNATTESATWTPIVNRNNYTVANANLLKMTPCGSATPVRFTLSLAKPE